ncbi:MAG: hypothetical protein AAF699_08735 [Pseudomonadota bacterium]
MKSRARPLRDHDRPNSANLVAAEPTEALGTVDIVLDFPVYATFMTVLFFISLGAASLIFTV